MRISVAFPSKYLKAADLQGQRVRVRVSHIDMEAMQAGEDDKPVVYFVGKVKGLVLNRTNADAIAIVHGDETDNWHGHEIELFETTVSYQGRSMPGIRVHVPRAPQQRAAPIAPVQVAPPSRLNGMPPGQPAAVPVGTVIDDEIPF